MFFGTIRSIKIGNFDEWAVDGRGSQRNFKEIHKHFIATIINSFGFSFVYFNFSLIYQHDFQQPRYFRPIIQLLRWDRVWIFMCMPIKKHFSIGSLFIFNILLNFFKRYRLWKLQKNSTETSMVKNQNRDSRTLFCTKIISEAIFLIIIFTCQIFTHNQWRVSSADSAMNWAEYVK